jgi:mono/diheme cytochrome c family protein
MESRNLVAALGLLGLVAVGANAQTQIKDVPVTYTSPTSGKEMFKEYCAVCHGPNGTGDGPAKVALKKAPADLTQLTAKNGGKFPDLRISRYISGEETTAAHGTREMPIWGKAFNSLNDDKGVTRLRIQNLSDYVKTLQAK